MTAHAHQLRPANPRADLGARIPVDVAAPSDVLQRDDQNDRWRAE